ncbi:MAG: WD40 repeat domain-containing serine/threonine-protein kinase [Limisphaerales bacterium]
MIEADAALTPDPAPPPPEAADAAGLRFGDYVLEAEIAHGGMGVVYRARQTGLGRVVALKLLLLGRHAGAESVERFRREAQSAAALRHPNIVAIHEVGECEGQHYFSMELVEGRNLAEVLCAGPLPPRRAAEIARAIAEAVQFAHGQGVLHRDLKPSNVLLDAFGVVRLTDFGLAKKLDGSSDLTVTGQLVGTPNYLSPEAATGRHDAVGPASDVYSLGALLYELLTGRPPFLAGSLAETLLRIRDAEPVPPRALNAGVPRDLETICLKCLEKEITGRYATAGAVAGDLGRWLRDEPIHARPATPAERAVKWVRRNPRLAGLLAFSTAALAVVLITLAVANVRIRAANARTAAEAEESRRGLVRLNVQTGNRFTTDGDPFAALAWYVEALALGHGDAAREDVHRRRIAAVLRQAPALEQLWFHDAFVTEVEISPDGEVVAAVSLDGVAKFWDARTGRARPGPDRATTVRFGPDNRQLLTWLRGEGIRFWNVADGSPAAQMPVFTARQSVHYAPDGRRVAVSMPAGAQLFDVTSGAPLGAEWPAAHPVTFVRFLPDSRRLAGLDDTGRLTLWDTAPDGGAPRQLVLGAPFHSWAFRPDGRRLAGAIGGNRGPRAVRQWDLEKGEQVGPDLPHASGIQSVQYSPDGARLVTAEWGGEAHLWDAAAGQRLGPPMQHLGGVRTARFSPDGRRLATASWDTTVRFWHPETARAQPPLLRHGGFVTSLVFSQDGTRLLTGSQDTAVRLWRLATNRPARLELRHGGTVFRTRYDPAGTKIVTAGEDGTARVWDRGSGELGLTLRHAGPVADARFSPDGRLILTASTDGTARLWDAATGEPIFPGVPHGHAVVQAEFSPDGRRFLTRGGPAVRVWDVANGAPLTPPLDRGAPPSCAAFSLEGARLVTGHDDGMVQVWELPSGQPNGPRLDVGGQVRAATFSPDGRRLLTGWLDPGQLPSAAQLWDAATGEKVGQPMWHFDGLFHAEFSPDGRRIASCGEDNTARVWDATTGEPVTPPLRHRAYVYTAAFSPDGRLVATASEDGTTRLWEVETGEAVTPPLEHEGRAGWVGWSPDGREIATGWNENAGRIFDVSPHPGPLDRLRLQAELLGTQRLHPAAGATPLSAAELRARWDALRAP